MEVSPAAWPVIAAQKASTPAATVTRRPVPRPVPVTARVVVRAPTSTPVSSQMPRSVRTKTPRSEPKRSLPTRWPVAIE